ncbi:MAG TPA: hypothetical protein VGL57_02925 [Solirubrobacteraceae bacterium]|jgi:hypothetical protein
MPTSRPRYTITETEEVAQALDRAARHWPKDASRRGQLLVHLVQEGNHALEHTDEERRNRREAAVQRTAGALTGVYPADYLQRLRDDWPS